MKSFSVFLCSLDQFCVGISFTWIYPSGIGKVYIFNLILFFQNQYTLIKWIFKSIQFWKYVSIP
jgi:hypothetical protein